MSLDIQYLTEVASPRAHDIIFNSYEGIEVTGLDNIPDNPFLAVSPHKSHIDYGVIPFTMFDEKGVFPRILAGENLLKGKIAAAIRKYIGVDFAKVGVIPMPRANSPDSLRKMMRNVESALNEDPVLVFPEYFNLGGKPKGGRSYTGALNSFASVWFSSARRTSVPILPVTVSYEFVSEDRIFPELIEATRKKLSSNPLVSMKGSTDYILAESSFFLRASKLGKGKIYLDIGEPFESSASYKHLAEEAHSRCAAQYRVTNTALVAYTLMHHVLFRKEIVATAQVYLEHLIDAGINVQESFPNWRNTLQDMQKRGLIKDRDKIVIKKQGTVEYYSNTITHHFNTLSG